MEIGFIGLGRMGSRMARRLIDAGHALAVYDVNDAACRPLVECGARLCASPGEVARSAAFVLSSVPGPAEVAAIMDGPEGVVANAREGALAIEMSTIGPAQSRALADGLAARGAGYIDAPVNNGPLGAEKGELTIMVGGEAADFERARPVLRTLGTHLYHMGPIGSGNIAKALNQSIFLSYVVAYCEAARLGRRAGLDVAQLVDMLRNSVGGNPLMTGWDRHIPTEDLTYGFLIRRVLKDLGMTNEIREAYDFEAPMLDLATRTFREMGEAGHMETDMTAIYVLVK